MAFPAPDTLHPVLLPDGRTHAGTVFLKAAINHPRIEVGDYSYASAFDPPGDWAACLAPYLFDFSPEKLIIGKFCQIADGVTFVTSSANHRYDGFSSYPFMVFDPQDTSDRASMPDPGPDTVIGNDVWIGKGAIILPGTVLGNGVIVGAGAVVSGHFADYSVAVGNPAKTVRMRYDRETVRRLQVVAWWDWPIKHIVANEAAIVGADIDAIENVAP